MKFPQGEGSAVIHRKKNRPALQRHDILTVFLVFFFFSFLSFFFLSFFLFSSFFSFFFFLFFFFYFCIGNLLSSSCTKFLLVLFFIAFYTAPFSSKHFFLGLFVRSLSTQQFFVMVLLLLLSMTCFLLCRAPFPLFLSATFSRCFPEPSTTQLFSWGVVFWAVCRARIRSLVSFFS